MLSTDHTGKRIKLTKKIRTEKIAKDKLIKAFHRMST